MGDCQMSQENTISSPIFTHDEMLEILKGYREVKNKVLQLEFEISNYESMLLKENITGPITFNEFTVSKKTEQITLKYKQDLEKELCLLRVGKERIEYYISLLDEKFASVLRLLYIDGKTILETSEYLHVSDTTIKNIRRVGIRKLIDMYTSVSR